MQNRLYFFKTKEGKFVFDGNNVAIYQYTDENDILNNLPTLSCDIDSHRSTFLDRFA